MKMKKLIAVATMAAILAANSVIAYADANVGCENGKHQPDLSYTFEADYHDCTGGVKVDSYSCELCYAAVDINGYEVEYFEAIGPHVPGVQVEREWSSCGGGYPEPVYECEMCGWDVLEDGSEALYVEGDGKHTPDLEGECKEANYLECNGGYKEDRYKCSGCGDSVFADGREAVYTEGTGIHTPDLDNVIKANYIPCEGGYKEDHYVCIYDECGTYVNAQGEEMEYIEAEASHTLEYVPMVEPTVEKEGCKEHWKCTACGKLFADEDGAEVVFDFELVIDKLDKVEEPDVNEPEKEEPTDKPVEDDTQKDETAKGESDTVKTGDSTNTIGYLTAMVGAMAAVVVILKRKYA